MMSVKEKERMDRLEGAVYGMAMAVQSFAEEIGSEELYEACGNVRREFAELHNAMKIDTTEERYGGEVEIEKAEAPEGTPASALDSIRNLIVPRNAVPTSELF